MTDILTRAAKGAALLHNEMDQNLTNLQQATDNHIDDQTNPHGVGLDQIGMTKAVGNVMSPLLHLPLKNDLNMLAGKGRVSFSRSSGATYIDRYGVLRYSQGGSVTNLLTYSEDFSQSNWMVRSATNTQKSMVNLAGPCGATSVGVVSCIDATDYAYVWQLAESQVAAGGYVTLSSWVKKNTTDNIRMSLYDTASGLNGRLDYVFSTHSLTTAISAEIDTISADIVESYDGWVRLALTVKTTVATTSLRGQLHSGTFSGITSTYFCQTQIELSKFANGYVKTNGASATATVDGQPRFEKEGLLIEGESTNLLTYSEDFTQWSATRWTASTDGALAPDGISLARKMSLPVVVGATNGITSNNMNFTAGSTYTKSVFAKAGSGTGAGRYLLLETDNYSVWSTMGYVVFDLVDGVITKKSNTSLVANIVQVAGGWYRCSLQLSCVQTANTTQQIQSTDAADGITEFDADGTEYVYLWGAQVEALPFDTSYIPTTSTAATRATDVCFLNPYGNIPISDELSTIIDVNLIGNTNDIHWRYIYGLYYDASNNFILRCSASAFVACGCNPSDVSMVSLSTLTGDIVRVGISLGKEYQSLYMNGEKESSNTVADFELSSLLLDERISIGAYNMYGGLPLYGHLSNFRIYDKALTEEEMRIA